MKLQYISLLVTDSCLHFNFNLSPYFSFFFGCCPCSISTAGQRMLQKLLCLLEFKAGNILYFYPFVLATAVAGGTMLSSGPPHAREHNISGKPWGDILTFGTNIHLDLKMNGQETY